MTHTIIASIALAFALYFTINAIQRVVRSVIGAMLNSILACAFWGLFYYCTHA